MFGMGWSEMVLIGIVALIVIGPKDLPNMFRTLGQFTGKARGMAREFSRAMEAAADESGVKDISKTIKAAANPQKFGIDKIREATGMSGFKPGGATEALSKERQETKAKYDAAATKIVEDRKAREAQAAAIAASAAEMEADAGVSAPAVVPVVAPAPKPKAAAKPKAAKVANAPEAAAKAAPAPESAPKTAAPRKTPKAKA